MRFSGQTLPIKKTGSHEENRHEDQWHQDPVESHTKIDPHGVSPKKSHYTASTMHDADKHGKIQAASAAHLDASRSSTHSEYSTPQKPLMPPMSAHNDATQDHNSGASAMQLNAAPMSCSEYSTPQKPLMPPAPAHNNAHNKADLRARFNAGHFRLRTRNAC